MPCNNELICEVCGNDIHAPDGLDPLSDTKCAACLADEPPTCPDCAQLRKAIEEAYREGWFDGASTTIQGASITKDSMRLDYAESDACAAALGDSGEGEKDA